MDVQDEATGDNLYDVFANQETNPFASTDLFGRLQPYRKRMALRLILRVLCATT